MDGNRVRRAQGIHAPDTGIQGFPAEDDARVFHEKGQQLEFLVRQGQFPVPDKDPAGVRFYGEAAEGDAPQFLRSAQPSVLRKL